ncbi:MAG: 50S ribosomal protein L37ae [Candidatus Altiarchaeota archaeon]|nr:50S ribosomal protein L37ae [Candidatus Altiarchaeota archaeon]
MYSHTRKVGSLGRYGPRIGRKLRDEIKKVEDLERENKCPDCGKRVKRTAFGIWECSSCGIKFTSGAYTTTKRG